MTPDQYEKAGEIYHAALELPPEQRGEFLDRACGGDRELRDEVASLLAAHADAGEFIETPAADPSGALKSVLEPPASSRELTPGQPLGRYEILGVLGAGGMGTVYRALDPSLGREVAIKALAPTFRGDSASLRRFEREARVLAALSHPNIATIYGFERLDGSPYLVLERVDGQTLAARLASGPMTLADTLAVAEQIVAGLEEAHSKGVVHRDLKPSNIMLMPDGRVKVVDFGLAKTVESAPRPALAGEPITAAGVVIGTARYMSPEQVKGESVDLRTDVWAFGCVLYEMLTGRPVFAGRSVSEVVAAVLRDDPDWHALPAATPAHVTRLLRRCLRRDPRVRLQHIGDARVELADVEGDAPLVSAGQSKSALRQRAPWLVAAAALTALGALALWGMPGAQPSGQPARLSLEMPSSMTLSTDYPPPFAIAPAGSPLVFVGIEGNTQRLYVRELSDPAMRTLTGTEGARQPFFSPDGRWIGFFAGRRLSKVPVNGGAVLTVADVGGNPRGGTWAPDGSIVYAAPQTAGLSRLAEAGGKPAALTRLDKPRGESSHRWPHMLPGGKWVIFTVGYEDASYDEAQIDAVSLETGERRKVLSSAGFASFLSPDQLLFVRGGRLHAVAFDPQRLEIHGTPEVVLDPVHYDFRNGGGHLAVSSSGVVMYGPGAPVTSDYYLAWVDRDGRVTRPTDTPRAFRTVKASPDGSRIATVIGTLAESDLWLVESNGTLSRLSFSLSPYRPIWTPDGSEITVAALKEGRWRLLNLATDGKREPRVLLEREHRVYPNAWSPDGRYLIYQENKPDSGWDLHVLALDADGSPAAMSQLFANTPFHEASAAISSDGRWVSYESDELDGIYQVYVRSFPDGLNKVRASDAPSRWAAWDARGNLHYWRTSDDTLQVVTTMVQGKQLIVGAPQPIWRGPNAQSVLRRIVNPIAGGRYDLEPRGARFLVLEGGTDAPAPALTHPMVVLGWRGGNAGVLR